MHPKIVFNNSPVARSNFENHLGVYLGTKLAFTHHVKRLPPLQNYFFCSKVALDVQLIVFLFDKKMFPSQDI